MLRYAKNFNYTEAKDIEVMLWPYGLSISDKDQRAWEAGKSVPRVPRLPRGTGASRDAYWNNWIKENQIFPPEIILAEYAAAAYLLKRCGWGVSELNAARFSVASAVEANDDPISKLDAFFDGGIEGREARYFDALAWLMTVIKFALGFPAQAGIEAIAVPNGEGGFFFTARLADKDSIQDADGKSFHPRQVEEPTLHEH